MPDATRLMVADDVTLALGDVRNVFRTGPGQKVAYVTDAAWTPENRAAITALARDADQLFIEAVFLERDAALATMRKHLTARQAAQIAATAGARHVTPFHHSPRYLDEPGALTAELRRSLGDLRSGGAAAPLETAAALGEPGDQDGA
jgi:ribonuclease Z